MDREETKLKEGWEQARVIFTAIENKPVYGHKIRRYKASKLMPFPWDINTADVSQETIDKLKDDIKRRNRHGKDIS